MGNLRSSLEDERWCGVALGREATLIPTPLSSLANCSFFLSCKANNYSSAASSRFRFRSSAGG